MSAVLNPNRIVKKKEAETLFSLSEKMKRNATTQNSRAAWPSGLRRGIQAPIRKGEGSNPSAVIKIHSFFCACLLFGYTVVPSARQV
jgi:hypothetical protein